MDAKHTFENHFYIVQKVNNSLAAKFIAGLTDNSQTPELTNLQTLKLKKKKDVKEKKS